MRRDVSGHFVSITTVHASMHKTCMIYIIILGKYSILSNAISQHKNFNDVVSNNHQ